MDASEARREFLMLHEIVSAARARLDQNMWDYVAGGTETETTLLRNRRSLDKLAFRPRVLRDVSRIDHSHDFFGRRIRLPILLAPVGGLEAIGEGGGLAVARAAGAFGVPFVLSSASQPELEEVGAAATSQRVYQLYARGGPEFIDDHARRAIKSGYDAFCLTVDTALYSRRERDMVNRFDKPWRRRLTGMEHQAKLSWADVARFKATHGIKLILKGIATREDAELACDHEVEAIYVSNHGGRQLDHGRGSMDVLPEIVAAVAGRARIIVDGGFYRGSDIVKAVALGADLVGLGRIYCYGLAAAGEVGIIRVLELLEAEVIECLGLLGVTSLAELCPSHLCASDAVTQPHLLSAFPLLDPAARTG